jgi:hypothetical protein
VDESPLARSVTANRFGISAVALATVSIVAFSAATGRGKGEEILPLGLSLLTGGAAALLAVTGWVRGGRRGTERVSVLCGFALACVGVGLVVVGGPGVIRNATNRQQCASNLRQIGQALYLYSIDNGGRLPDRLQDLTTGADALPADALVCPDGPDRPGDCSYDYLGKGYLFADFSADDIVAYEPPHNHLSDGGYALFGDGHIKFVHPAALLRDEVARTQQKLTTRPAATSPTTGPAID